MPNRRQAGPRQDGQRVFTCGHSFHWWVADMLRDMAQAAGISGHQVVGTSSIGGSRVVQHWDVPEEQNKAKEALRAGTVDVLTLSPIYLPDDGIEAFARLALEHNPDVRITVQEFWLPNDVWDPTYPLKTDKWKAANGIPNTVDHNAATVQVLLEQHEPYFRGMDDLVSGLNNRFGRSAVFVVPVGQAVIALRGKIISSQAPGLKTQAELFADSWGHPTSPLKVLAAYCHFAVIYRRSPLDLPIPAELQGNGQTEQLNRLLQELAWEAVGRHSLSGVAGKR